LKKFPAVVTRSCHTLTLPVCYLSYCLCYLSKYFTHEL